MNLKAFCYRHPGSKHPVLSITYRRLRTVDLGIDSLLEPAFHDHQDRGSSSTHIDKLDFTQLERHTVICICISPPWQLNLHAIYTALWTLYISTE